MAIFTAAAAIFTAVSTWIGGLSALGAFALKAAVGLGLSLAAQALSGKPKGPGEQTFSLSTSLQGGGDLSKSFIIGRAATGGSIVWVNTWGRDGKSPNAWLTQVISISDLPIRGVAEIWVDGEKVIYDYSRNNDTIYGYQVPNFNKDGANMYIKIYDGTQTSADPALMTIDSNAQRTWGEGRVGDGVAYAIVRTRATKNQFSGIPRIVFVVDGLKLYDPSRDSTNGGEGSQRYANPATWGGDGDDLPAVQLYNLMRGIYYKGQWIYGFQRMSPLRLDSTWITAINKCRLLVQGANGMEPQYRSGGEIVISARLSEAMDTLLTACQGEVAEAGGIYSLRVGEPESPLFSITDDDIISTDEQRFTPFFGLADSINGITGTYPEPLENWAAKSAPPLYRPDLEELDGNRRLLANVEFTFVPYAEQVQRLMKSALLSAMRTRRHTLTLPPKFWRYCVPGDTLRWSSERNGYNDKLFIIKGVVDRANLECVIDVLEWEPSDYNWSSSTEFKPPVIGSLGPIIPNPQPILDWNALPYIIRDQQNGARRPAIRLIWDSDPEALIGVRAVQWEIRVLGQETLVTIGSTDQPERGEAIISAGIMPNTTYEARGRFVPDDDSRDTEWSGWIPVLTDDVKLGNSDIEIDLGALGAETRDVFRALGGQIDELWKRVEHIGQAESLSNAVSEIARQRLFVEVGQSQAEIQRVDRVLANETEAIAQTVEEVRAVANGNASEIVTERQARVSGDEANATSIQALSSRVGSAEASLVTESQTRASEDEALASQITAVRAEIDTGFAEGAVSFEAVASPAGVNARYAILLRAETGGSKLATGLYLDLYTEGGVLRSRVVVAAQQFLVADDTVSAPVFAVIGGEVYMINAKIQQAQIENLYVNGNQIEPAASGFIKALTVPNTGGGQFDFVVKHGVNTPGTHHEIRFDVKLTLSRGGTGNTFNIGWSVYDLAIGPTVEGTVFSGIYSISAGQSIPITTFAYNSRPESQTATETVFRLNIGSSPNINWSNIQLGAIVTKNVPNDI